MANKESKKETEIDQIAKTLETISLTLIKSNKETEEDRMAKMWCKVKSDLYEKGLDDLDATAKSLVTLSSALITVGFTVIGGLVGTNLLNMSIESLWIALLGFGFFMVSTLLNILVIFRWPLKIEQLAEAFDISSAWVRIRDKKYQYLKWAYLSFGVGVIFVTIAIFFLIYLG